MNMIISLIIGMICGIFPAIFGLLREQFEIGIYGFVSCIVSALLFGIYISIPISFLFLLYLVKRTTATNKRIIGELVSLPVQPESERS
ncbi:hypothetical protein P6P90_00125 [Ectobacillus antri]|jgi:hypothetical protein|uniref:Uncharacterized protein n=1 Tax=Ectobacillus antri TaxID=2486280 RepID=A0ABT6H1A8_9BACI|nr:hypothetical protein [Ectobacillus antri]MDG4655730.1 hypothetical protein [Ectobacillus antri]MDG5752405.1 hypothetical protein [Ectobacillus antri]